MDQENDIESCKRLLNEIADLCDHASLTGSLSSGAKRTAQRYNTVLAHLVNGGSVPSGLFTEVPEDSDFGEIGVEARMLASYFKSNKFKDKGRDRDRDDHERSVLMRLAPFVRQEELGMLVREQRGKGAPLDMETLTHLAPFLGQDILSELLREHLSKPAPTESPRSPAPPQPTPSPAPVQVPAPTLVQTADLTLQPVSTASDSLEDLLNLLKSPYLSDEERTNLVDQVKALSR